jgi:hypothetical protein
MSSFRFAVPKLRFDLDSRRHACRMAVPGILRGHGKISSPPDKPDGK